MRIRWLFRTVESKAYLREYNVVGVMVADVKLLLYIKLYWLIEHSIQSNVASVIK